MEREPRELRRAGAASSRSARRRGAAPVGADAHAEVELQQLDRLASIGRLAAETAHEVRNALTAVKTFLQLLPDRGDDPEFRGPFHALASEEVGRMERLLDALLAQARGGAAPATAPACDAGAVVDAVASLIARRAAEGGLRVTVELAPDLPRPAIAADALRQVLLNLALNALDATPPGGDVLLAARALGPALELSVADRGPGIPPALRERVFEPWVSTHAERPGGLGLAIARRLVEEAGGTIAIGDRPQGGARLKVRLPVRG